MNRAKWHNALVLYSNLLSMEPWTALNKINRAKWHNALV